MIELVDRVLGGLKVPLRAFFVTRLKAKGGGGTPRLAICGFGGFWSCGPVVLWFYGLGVIT